MPIAEEILNQIKCCFYNDGHIAIEPIKVTCGAIGCKQCVLTSTSEEIECFSCKGKHKTQDLKNTPVIIYSVENLVNSNVSDLLEYVKINLNQTAKLLEGKKEIFCLLGKLIVAINSRWIDSGIGFKNRNNRE